MSKSQTHYLRPDRQGSKSEARIHAAQNIQATRRAYQPDSQGEHGLERTHEGHG